MNFQATGRIYRIFETEQVKDTFRKREVILEYATNPQYPQFVKFEFMQDACDLLNNFVEGQDATIDFDLAGREYTSPQGEVRYFTTLKGWRIVANSAGNQAEPAQSPSQPKPAQSKADKAYNPAVNSVVVASEADEDLPF